MSNSKNIETKQVQAYGITMITTLVLVAAILSNVKNIIQKEEWRREYQIAMQTVSAISMTSMISVMMQHPSTTS
jgi:hypothetical protein